MKIPFPIVCDSGRGFNSNVLGYGGWFNNGFRILYSLSTFLCLVSVLEDSMIQQDILWNDVDHHSFSFREVENVL